MSELIFVTGASGFLGSHIVIQLLQQGYRVRATARGEKALSLQASYARFGNRFEAVSISDISIEQLGDALKGVNAVIHAASPIAGKASPAVILKGAIEGTLNVLRQAEQAGIKRIVVTSSIATVMNPKNSFTDQDWNPVTKEEALDVNADPMKTYAASKTLAEREVWAFADAHPGLEITTLNPPFFYGPLAEGFTAPAKDYSALSTDVFIYRLLTPAGPFPNTPAHVDIRDVAKAHILALNSPPTSVVARKRIIFASPCGLDFGAVRHLISEKRPNLRDRLTKTAAPSFPYDRIPIDFGRIEQVLGMTKDDFKTVEDTMLDTVDTLLALEKRWEDEAHHTKSSPSL